jgi:voltage-gated potassium channel
MSPVPFGEVAVERELAQTWMNRLRRIVEENDNRPGRAFDLAIQTLIVLSLVAFSIDTLPNLSPSLRRALDAFEAFTLSVFVAEYALRVLVACRKRSFVFSFYGLVDLLAIAPVFLPIGLDLRSLRVFRLLRLIRILKLFRYNRAADRFRRAFVAIRAELTLFLAACLMVLYLASVGIYYFEHPAQPEAFRSVFSSMWWAVATLTTVGYGDIYPITTGGRLFTALILFVGLGVVAIPAGLVASALSAVFREEEEAG